MSDPSEQRPAPAPGWAPPAGAPFGPGAAAAGTPARYAPPVLPPGRVTHVPAPPRGPALGIVALVVAVAAVAGASLVGAWAAFRIGMGAGAEIAMRPMGADFDWSVLSPVREHVLTAELAFWAGTLLGLWALVQGIVAIIRGRGRGLAIAAVVLAATGPVVFFLAVQATLAAGLAAGGSIGG
ncbi:hypothetical protein [Microbacterium aureliae]